MRPAGSSRRANRLHPCGRRTVLGWLWGLTLLATLLNVACVDNASSCGIGVSIASSFGTAPIADQDGDVDALPVEWTPDPIGGAAPAVPAISQVPTVTTTAPTRFHNPRSPPERVTPPSS